MVGNKIVARKIVEFGKVDFNRSGRRNCKTEIDIRLYQDGDKKELAISGRIGNCFGQCLDEMAEFLSDNAEFNKLYRWWKLYHLNGMHAGTEEQEAALKECPVRDYTLQCDFLKSKGLYKVMIDGKPYKYGHAWLYRAIPEPDLSEIEAYLAN